MEPILSIQGLEKSFGPLKVLKGIDLEVEKGEVVCIIGASGSGKSTLLRCLNLLEEPERRPHLVRRPGSHRSLHRSGRPAPEDRHGVPGLQSLQQ